MLNRKRKSATRTEHYRVVDVDTGGQGLSRVELGGGGLAKDGVAVETSCSELELKVGRDEGEWEARPGKHVEADVRLGGTPEAPKHVPLVGPEKTEHERIAVDECKENLREEAAEALNHRSMGVEVPHDLHRHVGPIEPEDTGTTQGRVVVANVPPAFRKTYLLGLGGRRSGGVGGGEDRTKALPFWPHWLEVCGCWSLARLSVTEDDGGRRSGPGRATSARVAPCLLFKVGRP